MQQSVPDVALINHVQIQRGGVKGSGPPLPLKNHKNIGFFSNTGPDPLKNHKATKPALNFGPYRHASKTPFK